MQRAEEGFTLVETLVAIALFSALAVGFYQVMFAGVGGSDTNRSVIRISEEARLAFNRMVRDTREADLLVSAGPTSYRVQVDFDANGSITPPSSVNASGDYEDLTFAYDEAARSITLNGEVLMQGVEKVAGKEVFSFSSNRLEYDWNANGVTEWQELDAAPTRGVAGVGNNNGILDSPEMRFLSNVNFALLVREEDRSEVFYSQAQLRNRR